MFWSKKENPVEAVGMSPVYDGHFLTGKNSSGAIVNMSLLTTSTECTIKRIFGVYVGPCGIVFPSEEDVFEFLKQVNKLQESKKVSSSSSESGIYILFGQYSFFISSEILNETISVYTENNGQSSITFVSKDGKEEDFCIDLEDPSKEELDQVCQAVIFELSQWRDKNAAKV